MLAKRIIPTLLARGTTLVKGERFDGWRSVGHVLQAARIYQERGVDELIILDIAATHEKRKPDLKLVEELTREAFMPITYGGGVKSVQDVRDLLNAGADKIAIGQAHMFDDALIPEASAIVGCQAIVAIMNCSIAPCACCAGKEHAEPTAGIAWAKQLEAQGAGELMVQAVELDGTMQGYDLSTIKAVADAVDVPIIASGGCGSYEDMYQAIKAGADAVAAGALWQFTDATPIEAARYLHERGIEVRL